MKQIKKNEVILDHKLQLQTRHFILQTSKDQLVLKYTLGEGGSNAICTEIII